MILNKKFFAFTFLIVFVLVLPPAIVIPILLLKKNESIDYYIRYSWKKDKLDNEISKRKNFIMYFGTPQCPYCKKMWSDLNKSESFQKKMKLMRQKKQRIILFSEDKRPSSTERESFGKYLNDNILAKDKKKVSGGIGVPFFVFFKDGKAVETYQPPVSLKEPDNGDKWIKTFLTKINSHFPD